ncbi:MAG: hypothetical protein ACXVFC_09160 [Gaiellaceae bacterium]
MKRWAIWLFAAGALVAAPAAISQVVLAPTVYHSASLPSDSIRSFTVTCPPGYFAVSAGVTTAAPGVTTLSIRPASGRAFVFRFGNPSTNPDRTITVAVACRKIKAVSGMPRLKLVRLKTKPVLVPVEGQKQVVIQCPKGTVPAGGGVDLAPPKGKALAGFGGSPLRLLSQSSGLKRFGFDLLNTDSKPHAAVLYGNCVTLVRPPGSDPGRLQVKVTTETTPVQPGSHTLKRSCLSGWVALATGYTLGPKLTLGGSAAVGGAGKWTIVNGGTGQVFAKLQLTCARIA